MPQAEAPLPTLIMQADTSEGVLAEQIEVLMVLTRRFEENGGTTVAVSLWLDPVMCFE